MDSVESVEITNELAEELQRLWKETGKGKISVQEARKRLQKAKDHGCLLLPDCSKCPKVRECPVLNLEGGQQ